MQMYHRSQSGSTVRLQMTLVGGKGGGVGCDQVKIKKKKSLLLEFLLQYSSRGGCCLAQKAGKNIPGCHTYQAIA